MRALLQRAVTTLLNFVRENTRESSTRLVMICLMATGCLIGLAIVPLSWRFIAQPFVVPLVHELRQVAEVFVVPGCVAIALRTRSKSEPGDGPQTPPPPAPTLPT